jgi:serine/threonine-protein kinase
MRKACRLKPGDRLGSYRIVRALGFQQTYWHYAARARGTRHFADALLLKCLAGANDESVIESTERRMRFDEATIGTLLLHPNIARFHETGYERDICYLVMELVSGMTLTRMVRLQPLPVPAVISLGLQMLDGLHYAHKLRLRDQPLELMHRHLSTEAVIVTAEGRIKLVDFDYMVPAGLYPRKHFDPNWHVSPEQARGHSIDCRTDVFGAAVVLYEASTGRFPFAGDSQFDVLKNIVRKPADPLCAFASCYPHALEDILLKALEKDAARRYQTAAEFRTELEAAARALDVQPDAAQAALAQCFDRAI